jgi:prolipoprotein diacylglyceryltransferase
MNPLTFVLALAAAVAVLFFWSFRHLPQDRWQFIGTLLAGRDRNGSWRGTNLTYYGFFNANAYLLSLVTVFLLLGSAGVSKTVIFAYTATLLAICVPASRLVARLVEKKRFTFSVAGASFVGLLISPWLAWLMDGFLGARLGLSLPTAAALAAVSPAYAIGEGIGRLACISFGCCYGKPVSAVPSWLQRLWMGRPFVFSGKTKKIAYADRLDGQEVVPVQAMTAVLSTAVGLVGVYLFLEGHLRSAFFLPLAVTQLWRFASEFLRADYRGRSNVTVYQQMCLAAVLYGFIVAGALHLPVDVARPDLAAGLGLLWDPLLLLFFQGVWVFSFFYTGRSDVTAAQITLRVLRDRI